MNTISVYATGDRSSVSYYRIWQYVDRLNDFKISPHVKYPNFLIKHFNPIGLQPFYIKLLAWICMCIKVFFALFFDFFYKPNFIFVQRCFVKKKMPKVFRIIINLLVARGTRIIWDFDDNILTVGEISRSDFTYLSKMSFRILVTHDYLKSLVPDEFKEKVVLFRTTDGDMYKFFEQNRKVITSSRKQSLNDQVNLVWVATKGNLPYLENVISVLDNAAEKILEKDGRELNLKVICNGRIDHETKYLHVQNIEWTRDGAVKEMLKSHIGIMPLVDSDFARGKGAFKLIQYMSVGLPCIASAVGFNKDVLNESFGCLTYELEDWIDAVEAMSDINTWEEKSRCSFDNWVDFFSFESNLDTIEKIFTA